MYIIIYLISESFLLQKNNIFFLLLYYIMDNNKYIPIEEDDDNTNIFLILLYMSFFAIIIFILYRMNVQYNMLLYTITQNTNNTQPKTIIMREKGDNNVVIERKNEKIMTPFDFMREYDYRTLNDPLVEPRRRDDYNLPVLPVPTRGFPPPFKKMGVLVNEEANDNDKFKFLLLMGRNRFPNSNVYNYYAVENDKNSALKFHIHKTKELQSDDHVKIPELHNNYKVVLDKTLGYEYDPYIY